MSIYTIENIKFKQIDNDHLNWIYTNYKNNNIKNIEENLKYVKYPNDYIIIRKFPFIKKNMNTNDSIINTNIIGDPYYIFSYKFNNNITYLYYYPTLNLDCYIKHKYYTKDCWTRQKGSNEIEVIEENETYYNMVNIINKLKNINDDFDNLDFY